jgi:GrpB-like predicted nucleotidyltransferase (UPF0157 family)
MQRRIEVVAHRPEWAAEFVAERDRLAAALGDAALAIHHIGSTSVPGLSAKPVIDILVAASDLAAIDACRGRMEVLGYEAMGELGIPGRRYFRKGGAIHRTHHVHAFAHDDPGLDRHLAFRDYLRAHPEVAREYGELKERVAATCENDIDRYMAGKDAFVQRVEALALDEWRTDRGAAR